MEGKKEGRCRAEEGVERSPRRHFENSQLGVPDAVSDEERTTEIGLLSTLIPAFPAGGPKPCRYTRGTTRQDDSKSPIVATSCFTASTLLRKSAVSDSVSSNSITFSTPPLPITTGTPT